MNTEITLHETDTPSNLGFLRVNSFVEAIQVGEFIKKTGFAPKGMSVEDIVLAMQMGLEVGLKPLQAVQNISVINGKPSLWGDAMLALCKSHPDWEYAQELFDAATQTAKCVVKRRGEPEAISEFSMDMAKKAGLAGKTGPWQQYPERMLQMRARGFALRDAFPDALKGLISTEEARDYPPRNDLSKEKAYTVEAEPVNVTPAPLAVEPPSPVLPETLKILLGYMAAHDTKQDTINAWLKQNNVPSLKFLPEFYAQKLLARFKKHEEELMQLEEEQNQQNGEEVYHV